MQPSKLKIVGFVLLLVAVISALVLQATGFELVTRLGPNTSSTQTTTRQGTTITMSTTEMIIFHWLRVLPLAALGVAGLVCLAMGWRRNQPSEVGP
jgi:hypothetical protein